VAAAGGLDAASLSCALQACDLLIQPYPDGASTRRTTLMAALAHGVPVVTTVGRLSEAFWSDSPIVTTVPAGDLERLADEAISLARDAGRRAAQAAAGREEYRRRFEISHTVAALLADSCGTT
jgi:glycosyltransferase involved in cell wall biosynthesis